MSGLCNAGTRMSLGKWWLWALLGLLALYLLTLFSKWRTIEDDIQARTQAALNDNGYSWASVDQSNRGRDVLITGQAPDEGALSDAVALAQEVRGVRIVDTATDINTNSTANTSTDAAAAAAADEWVSSRFSLSSTGDKIRLTGHMPDQPSIDQLVQEASRIVGADKIDNQLTIDANAKDPDWLSRVIATLPVLHKLQNARLEAEDGLFLISGDAESEGIKNEISTSLNQIFVEGFEGEIKVTGPNAEELAASATAEDEAAQLADTENVQEKSDSDNNVTETLTLTPKQAERKIFLDTCQTRFNEIMLAENIEFATASAAVSAQSFPLLTKVIDLVKECNRDGDLRIEIAGHTDNVGDAQANRLLSTERVNAVMQYFINAGVKMSVLSAKSYGETQPIADNNTESGRAQNRRIQFNIQR